MKKLFLILSLFVFLGVASPAWGIGFLDEVFEAIDLKEVKKEFKEEASIFSDPGYTQPTHNFSPGQMVYIKVETSIISGDKEKNLRILDSEKGEVQRITLSQNGNLFTTSFAAPGTPGVYYVDIKIEDSGGSKFASQENINVGETDGSVSVSAEAESVVVQGNQVEPTLMITPTSKPETTPLPESPLEEKTGSLIDRIINFFQRLFSHLTRLHHLRR